MATFSIRDSNRDALSAPRDEVWPVMEDPDLIAQLMPLVDRIEVRGEHWRWCLANVGALGVSVSPCFTVAMTIVEPERIEFRHDPPPGARERAGASGAYGLVPFDGGTVLDIDLEMSVELPLPRLSRGAVQQVMATTTRIAGDRFFANLCAHLGATQVPLPAAH